MADISPGWTGSANNTASTTSLTIDISGATVGEWVYAFCQSRSNNTSQAITGWTSLGAAQALGGGTGNGLFIVFKRKKQSGDTTFSLTWTTSAQYEVFLGQWTGAHLVSPDEAYASQAITSAGNSFSSPSATPSFADRWAIVALTAGNGDSGHKTVTWTAPSGMVEFGHVNNPNTFSLWNGLGVFHSNGPVTAASHSYTGTAINGGLTMNNGSSAIFYLIPQEQKPAPTGVGTGEAFGTPTITQTGGGVTASPTSIASAEAFGSSTLSPGPVTASPNGIATALALGVPVSSALLSVASVGIASGEALGVPSTALLYTGAAVGIATLASVGTPVINILTIHTIENGTSGSSVLSSAPSDGSTQFDISQVTGTSATIQVSTTWAHSGTRSFRSLVAGDTAASAGWSSTVLGSLGPHVLVRGYFRWTGTPPNNSRFFTCRDSGGGYLGVRMNADGSIDVVNPQSGTSVASSAASQFPLTGTHTARVELDMTPNGTTVPFTVRVWYDSNMESTGTPDTTLSGTITESGHSDVNSIYWGLTYPSGQNPTFTLFCDDLAIVASQTAGTIGPLGVAPQTADISGNGIASSEAFGVPSRTLGPVTLSASGIVSSEAFGPPALVPGAVILAALGMSSAEALGAPTLVPGAITLSGAAIGSSEAFGAPSVLPGGVTLLALGIASAEALGVPTRLLGPVQLSALGIGSSETLGVPSSSTGGVNLSALGIASAEALGTPGISAGGVTLLAVGVGSGELLGVPAYSVGAVTLSVVSIGTGEAIPTPLVTTGAVALTPLGIASAEASGTPSTSLGEVILSALGIASAAVVGVPSTTLGGVVISALAIDTAESLGLPDGIAGALTVVAGDITSSESFGTPGIALGALILLLTGIPSLEEFGDVGLSGVLAGRAVGISSALAFGLPVVKQFPRKGDRTPARSVVIEQLMGSVITTRSGLSVVLSLLNGSVVQGQLFVVRSVSANSRSAVTPANSRSEVTW